MRLFTIVVFSIFILNALVQSHAGELETINEKISQGQASHLEKTSHEVLNKADSDSMTPLMTAALDGNAKAVSLLLKKKVDLNKKNRNNDSALSLAVGAEQVDIAKILISAKADTSGGFGENKESLLHSAIRTGNAEMIQLIMKQPTSAANSTDQDGNTPLMVAAEKNDAQTITLLLKSGADALLKNKEGKTAKDIATLWKSSKAIEALKAPKTK